MINEKFKSVTHLASKVTLIFLFLCNTPNIIGKTLHPPKKITKKEKIVFLGDSITAGYGVEQSKSYPALLEQMLMKTTKKNFEFINASISGSTTASALSRLKWQIKSKPNYLVLALGGNDGLRGIKVEQIKINLEQTIMLAKKNEIKILFMGIKVPPNYGVKYQQSFDSVFKIIANQHDVVFMPFLLKDVGGEKDLNQSDGIHPNAKGHEVIAKNVWPYFKKFLQIS